MQMNVSHLGTSSIVNPIRISIVFANLLLLFAIHFPLSLLNCWLQFRPSIIHPNLKCILLAQSLCFCGFGIARCTQIFNIFINGPEHLLDGKIIQSTLMFTLEFMNAIGHILLVERVVATLFYKNYEKYKSPIFTICWFIAICIYSAYTTFEQIFQSDDPNDVLKITPSIFISAGFWLALAFLEIFIISIIGAHNVKKYKRELRIQGEHNLSERFQLSENIRTARQLAPTFTFHFLNLFSGSSYPILLFFGLVADPIWMEMLSQFGFLFMAICNIRIEFTIISRHQILRRNAIQILRKLSLKRRIMGRRNRIENSNSMINLQTISSQHKFAANGNEGDEYFRILQKEWDEAAIQKWDKNGI